MKNVIVIGANGHVGAYTFDYLMSHLDSNEYHLIASGLKLKV
jgi:saccharopine dehydrogenase-like NADP-dependent oxidoreductase